MSVQLRDDWPGLTAFDSPPFHGEYRAWYETGQLAITGQYYQHSEVGVWRWYAESGELVREHDFGSTR